MTESEDEDIKIECRLTFWWVPLQSKAAVDSHPPSPATSSLLRSVWSVETSTTTVEGNATADLGTSAAVVGRRLLYLRRLLLLLGLRLLTGASRTTTSFWESLATPRRLTSRELIACSLERLGLWFWDSSRF